MNYIVIGILGYLTFHLYSGITIDLIKTRICQYIVIGKTMISNSVGSGHNQYCSRLNNYNHDYFLQIRTYLKSYFWAAIIIPFSLCIYSLCCVGTSHTQLSLCAPLQDSDCCIHG